MINKLGSNLKQFYEEPIYSKHTSNFFILTILLINGPRNAHQIYKLFTYNTIEIARITKLKQSEYTILYNQLLCLYLVEMCFHLN